MNEALTNAYIAGAIIIIALLVLSLISTKQK